MMKLEISMQHVRQIPRAYLLNKLMILGFAYQISLTKLENLILQKDMGQKSIAIRLGTFLVMQMVQ